MKNSTNHLFAGLLLTALFSACSRPVAYFQPQQREQFTQSSVTVAPQVKPADAVTPVVVVTAAEAAPSSARPQIVQTEVALQQIDALVRNDKSLSADKTVQKRLNRVRTLLTSTKVTLTPSATTTPRKASLMERFMLKKMDRKINRQLAPSNPNKPMASTGILAAGAVAVLVGLLILLLGGSGTLGVILLLAGAIVLLVGLLA